MPRWLCHAGLLLTPRDRPAGPALLFIAEPFGINREMKRVSGEFAAAGYAVLIQIS